jgi:hypothetical protein
MLLTKMLPHLSAGLLASHVHNARVQRGARGGDDEEPRAVIAASSAGGAVCLLNIRDGSLSVTSVVMQSKVSFLL